MNKSELIEIVAMVSIRLWALILCIFAFFDFLRWSGGFLHSLYHQTSMYMEERRDGYFTLFYLLIAHYFFYKTDKVSQFICRGLDQKLQKNNSSAI